MPLLRLRVAMLTGPNKGSGTPDRIMRKENLPLSGGCYGIIAFHLGNRDGVLLRIVLVSLFLLVINGSVHAQLQLRRKFVGPASTITNPWTNANISACQPAQRSDWQATRYVPGMIQGFFRFDWTLFKNGQQIGFFRQTWDLRGNNALSYQNYTHQNTFFNLPTDPGTYTAMLDVRQRGGPPWNYNFNTVIFHDTSPAVTISNITPTHSFKIKNANGVFVNPPPDGSPIQVSLAGGAIMDASASACETGYAIIVEESNSAWLRPLQNEWNKWFSGQVPANLNLQQLTTTYSQSDGTGYFSLIGGSFTSSAFAGQPRFYRIGLQSAGAPWNPQFALIQVNW